MVQKMNMLFLDGTRARVIAKEKPIKNSTPKSSLNIQPKKILNRFNLGSNMKAKSNGCGCGGFR